MKDHYYICTRYLWYVNAFILEVGEFDEIYIENSDEYLGK